MIIPSIDIQAGEAVQLIGGRERALNAGDPRPIAKAFGCVGEIAVIDLDAACSTGSNADIIKELLPLAACRVGGGIRTVGQAIEWLDRGASKVILGTAATVENLRLLPKDRTIAALDCVRGEVYDNGWTHATGVSLFDRMKELTPYVGGFLVTVIEREGQLLGADFELAKQLPEASDSAQPTRAGGIASAEEVARLDAMGIDAQVGMALYTGQFDLADALTAMLRSDRSDGLWPTVVTDERGLALGLAYSSRESLREAITSGSGVYQSRSRGIWQKGLTSGSTQQLLAIDLDCDRDTIRFRVRQAGDGFCHKKTRTCWGAATGLGALEERINRREASEEAGSYTRRLLADSALLNSKLIEEAEELSIATGDEVVLEAADLLYFLMVALRRGKTSLANVEHELDGRSMKLTRRRGDAKPATPREVAC